MGYREKPVVFGMDPFGCKFNQHDTGYKYRL